MVRHKLMYCSGLDKACHRLPIRFRNPQFPNSQDMVEYSEMAGTTVVLPEMDERRGVFFSTIGSPGEFNIELLKLFMRAEMNERKEVSCIACRNPVEPSAKKSPLCSNCLQVPNLFLG